MAPRPVTREKLCELFWDVADDPRSELRWCLSKLRPLVDAPTTTRLIADREQVRIDTNSLDIDAISLARSAQMTLTSGSPGDLQSLGELFRGNFLEGLTVDRVPLFDNWLAGQRHRFGQLRQQLLARLSFVLPPESDDRIEVLRECIEVAPFDEAAHIELVRTLLRRALYVEAEHQIDATVTLFQNEGIDPTSLKSAFAAAQRSVSKPAGMSLVDHLDAPCGQQAVRTRGPTILVMPFAAATPEECCGRRQHHVRHYFWYRETAKHQHHCPRHGFLVAQPNARSRGCPSDCAICRLRPSAARRQEISCFGRTHRPKERSHLLGG